MKRIVKNVFQFDLENKIYCCVTFTPYIIVQRNKKQKIISAYLEKPTDVRKLFMKGNKIYELSTEAELEKFLMDQFKKIEKL